MMITKDSDIGPKGDCIVAVAANKGGKELSETLKQAIRAGRKLRITLRVDNIREVIRGLGHPALTLSHPTDLVIRKSKFTCGRTLAVNADKAAADLSRGLVARLQNPATKVRISIDAL
jgi:hypothetical protein